MKTMDLKIQLVEKGPYMGGGQRLCFLAVDFRPESPQLNSRCKNLEFYVDDETAEQFTLGEVYPLQITPAPPTRIVH